MKIIGLNNEMLISSACLLDNGKVVSAAAEERFVRNKHTRSFPHNAIKFCLEYSNICSKDISQWIISWNPGLYFQKFNPNLSGSRRHLVEQLYSVPDNLMDFFDRPVINGMSQEFLIEGFRVNVSYINHHDAHAGNAFYLSQFENAAIMTADSQGEIESTTFSIGHGTKIKRINSFNYPHSLGVFYATLTEFLGFKPNSDEWKVMALGAYAKQKNKYVEKIKNIVNYDLDRGIELELNFFNGYLHELPQLFTQKMVDLLGDYRKTNETLTERHFEIAASMQIVAEEITFKMLNDLHKITKEKNLCVSGGFFMNSLMNGKLIENTPFEKLFISSCPDDSGNSIGASLFYYHNVLGFSRVKQSLHNFYGPSFSDQEIEKELITYKIQYKYYEKNIEKVTASLLSKGKIVGWFQGRMEFGQRALGNRSILGDPRDQNMKQKINSAVKFRENFRPFAPAVLKEFQSDFFEIGMGGDVPFMEKIYMGKSNKAEIIPAVFHEDNTCRIQTVQKENNKGFYKLIKEFQNITNIPVVLNTSFNLNDEPIVCTPRDAIKTFMNSGLDVLVIGNYFIEK